MKQSIVSVRYNLRVHATCYEPIRQAITASRHWTLLPVFSPEIWFRGQRLVFPGLTQIVHIWTHLKLSFHLLTTPKNNYIVVREFITVPLVLVMPLWWTMRHRIIFLVNHNFQFAIKKWSQRLGMKILLRAGARIAAQEISQRALVGESNTGEDIVWPFPISARPSGLTKSVEHKRLKIGIISSFRREQQTEELIEALGSVCADATRCWDLVVASHHQNNLLKIAHLVGAINLLTSDDDYWKALMEFDVIVLFYDKNSYNYRSSGIIADAITCGVPVICPNYPVLNRQVNWPVKMGLVYERLSELPMLIEEIARWRRSDLYVASEIHRQHRGWQAYVKILESLRTCKGEDSCKII